MEPNQVKRKLKIKKPIKLRVKLFKYLAATQILHFRTAGLVVKNPFTILYFFAFYCPKFQERYVKGAMETLCVFCFPKTTDGLHGHE